MCGGSKTYKHLWGAFPAEEPWNKASDKEHRPGHVLQEPLEGQRDDEAGDSNSGMRRSQRPGPTSPCGALQALVRNSELFPSVMESH